MTTEISITIAEEDADPERVDVLTGQLREELLQLDVEGVRRAPGGPAPEDARVVDVAAIGALLVTVAGVATSLDEIIGVLRRWAGGGVPRTVKIEIDGDKLELSNATRAQQRELIEAFVRRHPG